MRVAIWLIMLFVVFNGCSTTQQKRVALVIGNQNYYSNAQLKNAINDSKAIKRRLESLGFDVVYGSDVSAKRFDTLLVPLQQRNPKVH